jgi:hypothetical protein
MENKNKKESKLYAFFKDDNPKTLMILNGITSAIWVLVTVMNIYSMNRYAHVNKYSPIFTGGLVFFYIGMTIYYACKYAKTKKLGTGKSLEKDESLL